MTLAQLQRHCTAALEGLYEHREARNITQLLLEHVSGYSASQIAVNGPEPANAAVESNVQAALERLLTGEPVQYVLEEAWFYGRPFYVNRHVLIPRPETEELAERVLQLCAQQTGLHVLDVGTGSGCIPVTLALQLSAARIHAMDISTNALEVAAKNAARHGAAVHFFQMDFTDTAAWEGLPQYHVIVSNPPYIPLSGKTAMQPNVVNYEPHTALFVPDEQPLLFYELLARFGRHHVLPGGFIACEIHEDLGTAVTAVFETAGYGHVQAHRDMQGKERMVVARK
jgi:release factor glutamine methyltransferase